MIVDTLSLTAKAGPYIKWAWQNRKAIANFPREAGDFLVALAENGGNAIQRVGSQLILSTPDGGQRLLGFIDQTSLRLDGIEQAVSRVSDNHATLTSSIASLQTVSMVTLGLSAVTPVLLLAQFRYLSRQFNELKQSFKDLQEIIEKQSIAKLQSGLDVLENGVRKGDEALVKQAMMPCSESLQFFRGRLEDAIHEKRGPALLHYLTRHLAISMCAASRCSIALGYDDSAQQLLETHRPLLKQATRIVFIRAMAEDPSRFLIPELAKTVSFEFICSLLQQAEAAGATADGSELKKAMPEMSPTGLFEHLRPKLFQKKLGWFGRTRMIKQCKEDLRQAAAIIEETNRVLSLEAFLIEAKRASVRAIDALKELDSRKEGRGDGFVAWSF